MEGSHIQLGAELCKKYKESPLVINAVESHPVSYTHRIVDKDTKETSESIEKTTVIYDDEDTSVPYVTSTCLLYTSAYYMI